MTNTTSDLLVLVLEESGEERTRLKVVRVRTADGGLQLGEILVVALPVDLGLFGLRLFQKVELVLETLCSFDEGELLDELVVGEVRVLAESESDRSSTGVFDVTVNLDVGEVRESLVVGIVNVDVGSHAVDQSLEPEVLDTRDNVGTLLVERSVELKLVLDELNIGLAEVLDERIDLLLKSVGEGLGLRLTV